MGKKHFTGEGDQKIHTARFGACRKKPCVYRDNTADDPKVREPKRSHHILPVSTTIGYQSLEAYRDTRKTLDAVYRNTLWCVNQKPNMKWLPVKDTYTLVRNNQLAGKRAAQGEAPVWTMNLPCHDWDHLSAKGYNDEVLKAFGLQIWDAIAGAAAAGACPEDVDVVEQLEELTSEFRSKLVSRGTRKGGTKKAMDRKKQKENHWWLPFSMAQTPVAKTHTVRYFGDTVKVPALDRRK